MPEITRRDLSSSDSSVGSSERNFVVPEIERVSDSGDNIGCYPPEWEDLQMESAWEAHEKLIAPNGMSFHEMLAFVEDEDVRAYMIEIKYPHLVSEERLTPKDASRILLYSSRGLLAPEKVRRAIHHGVLLSQKPESERQFGIEAKGAHHRTELEEAIRNRRSLVPVTFGIGGIDELIPGGITAGEILQYRGRRRRPQDEPVVAYSLPLHRQRRSSPVFLAGYGAENDRAASADEIAELW